MIVATVKNHYPVLKELVRAGADLNLQNEVSDTKTLGAHARGLL